jgi:hypothetical protein
MPLKISFGQSLCIARRKVTPLFGVCMPIFGLGIHILIALYFAVHAMRNRQNMYWLWILFAFPGLGSVVYFFAIYLPGSRLDYSMRKAGMAVAKSLDPGKDMREAQHAFELTPTAQNQMRLAHAQLDAGELDQAMKNFDACLHGPFAHDPEIRFGAARVRVLNGQGAAALELLAPLRSNNPEYRTEQVALLCAQAHAAQGQQAEARRAFAETVERFGGLEARVEYAIWALAQGESDIAHAQKKEIEHAKKYWKAHTLAFNKDLLKRLDAAFAAQQKE